MFTLAHVSQTRNHKAVLSDISLSIQQGSFTVFIGPSGSGKTSLLRLLNRLDEPSAGEISFHQQPLASYPIQTLRTRAGFVFQQPAMFTGSVADNLAMALHYAKPTAREPADAQIRAALALSELSQDIATQDARSLSIGQQQRVSLARVLITQPEVLLLDEPTAALDPVTAERLVATFDHLRTSAGLSIIMVTHRLQEICTVATDIAVIDAGQLVEHGGARQVLTDPQQRATRELLAAQGICKR